MKKSKEKKKKQKQKKAKTSNMNKEKIIQWKQSYQKTIEKYMSSYYNIK